MIVDVHGHLGRTSDAERETAALHQYIESARLHRLLLSNIAASTTGEYARDTHEFDANGDCVDRVQKNRRLAAVYWVRPGRTDSNVHAVAGALEMEPFIALLLAPRWNEFEADAAMLDPYLSAAVRLSRPVFLISGKDERSRPRRAYALAQRFPRLPIILLNAGADAHWTEAVECVEKSVKRGDASLYLTTGHMPVEELLKAIKAVGAERVLFGSDAVRDERTHTHQVKATIDGLSAALPAEAVQAVLAGNAVRLLAIPREG